MKPRTNSDIIHAYADGYDVQFLKASFFAEDFGNNEFSNLEWIDYNPLQKDAPQLGAVVYKWRIKPNTIKYRVALCKMGKVYWASVVNTVEEESKLELEYSTLVQWLTDWIEVDVVVNMK